MGDDAGGASPINRAFGMARGFFGQNNGGAGSGPQPGGGTGGHQPGWGGGPGHGFDMDELRAFVASLRGGSGTTPPGGAPPVAGGGLPPAVPWDHMRPGRGGVIHVAPPGSPPPATPPAIPPQAPATMDGNRGYRHGDRPRLEIGGIGGPGPTFGPDGKKTPLRLRPRN